MPIVLENETTSLAKVSDRPLRARTGLRRVDEPVAKIVPNDCLASRQSNARRERARGSIRAFISSPGGRRLTIISGVLALAIPPVAGLTVTVMFGLELPMVLQLLRSYQEGGDGPNSGRLLLDCASTRSVTRPGRRGTAHRRAREGAGRNQSLYHLSRAVLLAGRRTCSPADVRASTT